MLGRVRRSLRAQSSRATGVGRPHATLPHHPGEGGAQSHLAPQAEGMLPPIRMGSSRVTDSGTEAAGQAMA